MSIPIQEEETIYSSSDMNEQERKFQKELVREVMDGLRALLKHQDPIQPESPSKHERGAGYWVALTSGVLGSLLMLGTGLNYIVVNAIKTELNSKDGLRDQVASLREEVGTLRDKDLAGLRKDFDYLRKDVDKLTVAKVFTPAGATQAKPTEVKDAADKARRDAIVVAPDVIKLVSDPLFKNPTDDKWEAIISLMNLRAFVNSTLEEAEKHVVQTVKPDSQQVIIKYRDPRNPGWVEINGGAGVRLDAGSSADPGGFHDLDGRVLNTLGYMIIRNSKVIYSGGKVTLINVFFVDCTYGGIPMDQNGERFAKAVLDPNPLTNFVAN